MTELIERVDRLEVAPATAGRDGLIGTADHSKRSVSLDLMKAMLVFFMVAYHCASVILLYREWPLGKAITGRLDFVHFSFVWVTGFLVGFRYVGGSVGEWINARKRVLRRGLKLLLIWILANLFAHWGLHLYDFHPNAANFGTASGVLSTLMNPAGDLLAYEMLYYIGLFLVIISVVSNRWLLGVLAVGLSSVIWLFPNAGLSKFLLYGFFGIAIGAVARNSDMLTRLWRAPRCFYGLPILIMLGIYLACWERLNAVAGLGRPAVMVLRIFELLLWGAAAAQSFNLGSSQAATDIGISIGKKTLFLYLAQMPLIRIIYHVIARYINEPILIYCINVFTVGTLMFILAVTVDWMSMRSKRFSKSYRFVFEG